jgi:hypothetical protein
MAFLVACSYFVLFCARGNMERIDQLRNVAFGGAWSEQIASREGLSAALSYLDAAADEAEDRDVRNDVQALAALKIACDEHPKGVMLHTAWLKAAGLPDRRTRCEELAEIATRLRIAQIGLLKPGG